MKLIQDLKNGDFITIDLFGKEKEAEVFSTGDNQFDENEIYISAAAINISTITESADGFIYPEISFYGDCECDPEHGICIGFRDKKFLGIHSQDWTL